MDRITLSLNSKVDRTEDMPIKSIVESGSVLTITLEGEYNISVNDVVRFSRFVTFEDTATPTLVAYHETPVLEKKEKDGDTIITVTAIEDKLLTVNRILVYGEVPSPQDTSPFEMHETNEVDSSIVTETEVYQVDDIISEDRDVYFDLAKSNIINVVFNEDCNIFAQDLAQMVKEGVEKNICIYDKGTGLMEDLQTSGGYYTNEDILLSNTIMGNILSSYTEEYHTSGTTEGSETVSTSGITTVTKSMIPYEGVGALDYDDSLYDFKVTVVSNDCHDGEFYLLWTPNYYYVPSRLIRNELFFNNLIFDDKVKILEKKCLRFPFNDFYFKKEDGTCILWEDTHDYSERPKFFKEGDKFKMTERENITYNSDVITKLKEYYSVPITFSENVDYTHFNQEEKVTTLFVNDIKQKTIDSVPVIDMERVKFAPHVSDDVAANTLVFNFHFRTRENSATTWNYVDTDRVGLNIYFWNNRIADYDDIVNQSATTVPKSDVLSWLGFTDEDIMYQKMKVGKSFIRLAFYNNTDPLTQKLLYSSTIFLDTGELYGKFIKTKRYMSEHDNRYDGTNIIEKSNNLPEEYRIDSKITVKDEYNTDKSSEGFNIYYFPDEIQELMDTENEGKTIYMKVEFNHAGFGRTLPFIACGDMGGENSKQMTIAEYRNHMYVEAKLKYVDGKYYYVFNNVRPDGDTTKTDDICIVMDEKNKTITFNLFEPKITQ